MDPTLRAFVDELYEFGRQNDATHEARSERMLNITPDTGELLRSLVINAGHQLILELGTSNGYSTVWLADACRTTGGRVVTVELNPAKQAAAVQNVRAAGLAGFVDCVLGEIGETLPGFRDFDLVFLDSERVDYPAWWPELQLAVRPGGLIVVDNGTSHAEEMAPFVELVDGTVGFSSVLVPIGNGELLILREP
jgi:predicted O-methyltransferase YrrM